jgi:hypothetical protein
MPSVERSITSRGTSVRSMPAGVIWGHDQRSPMRLITAAVLCGIAWA